MLAWRKRLTLKCGEVDQNFLSMVALHRLDVMIGWLHFEHVEQFMSKRPLTNSSLCTYSSMAIIAYAISSQKTEPLLHVLFPRKYHGDRCSLESQSTRLSHATIGAQSNWYFVPLFGGGKPSFEGHGHEVTRLSCHGRSRFSRSHHAGIFDSAHRPTSGVDRP